MHTSKCFDDLQSVFDKSQAFEFDLRENIRIYKNLRLIVVFVFV